MHPNDEAWLLWREMQGYSREESIKILRERESAVRVVLTDNTLTPVTVTRE